MILKSHELLNIKGGAISASIINYLTRGIIFIFELGKSFGSSISRLLHHNYCQ